MAIENVPEPLKTILSTIFNVNALGPNWKRDLRNSLKVYPEWPALFRQQLGELILHGTVSTEDYEKLTLHRFARQEYLSEYLRERWKAYYEYELTSDEVIMQAPPEPEDAESA